MIYINEKRVFFHHKIANHRTSRYNIWLNDEWHNHQGFPHFMIVRFREKWELRGDKKRQRECSYVQVIIRV